MIGIPYIESLFRAILSKSKVVEGRFFLCPFWGAEINKGNIAEIVEYAKPKDSKDVKYPVCLLMPVTNSGNFQFSGLDNNGTNAYSKRAISLVFIAQAYQTGQNQTINPQPNGLPQHTIPETWHDMERCAVDFLQVLHNIIENSGLAQYLYISEQANQTVVPVTCKGNDKVTGVMLKFTIEMNGGCDIEDYPADYLSEIVVPDPTDTHPIHNL